MVIGASRTRCLMPTSLRSAHQADQPSVGARRVLKAAGVLDRHNMKPIRKGKGFHQPSGPHKHWHIDISYLNLGGTFYYMCSILDGYSRFIVHWAPLPCEMGANR